MANPRKFSEKIALHNQKQAEETRAFEEIMKEMSSIANTTKAQPFTQQFHSGSLPNVNFPFDGNNIDLQVALRNLNDLKEGRTGGFAAGGRIGPMRDRRLHIERPTPTTFKQRFIGVDTSPYPAYLQTLQPPQNNDQAPWRRAASDSALHRSVMQPELQKSKDGNFNKYQSFEQKRAHSPQQMRPKSCEVPGLNSSSCSYDRLKSPPGVYPSSDQAAGLSAGMPVANTGSLPDLTNLHMNPSPLQTPIDAEDIPYNQASSQQFPLSPTRSQHMKRRNYTGPSLNKFQRQVQFDPNFSPMESRVQFQYYQQQNPGMNLDMNKVGSIPCSTASPTMSPTASSVSPIFGSFPTTPLSPFSEAYLKQQQNTAAVALQQQLEQFTMQSLNNPICSTAQLPIQSMYSQGQGLYGPNSIMSQYTSGVPDVIVTATEDDGGDFAKDISTAIGGVEGDLYSTDLKFDPLDIESLRMLSGHEPVTDPAAEESFRQDRLGQLHFRPVSLEGKSLNSMPENP